MEKYIDVSKKAVEKKDCCIIGICRECTLNFLAQKTGFSGCIAYLKNKYGIDEANKGIALLALKEHKNFLKIYDKSKQLEFEF